MILTFRAFRSPSPRLIGFLSAYEKIAECLEDIGEWRTVANQCERISSTVLSCFFHFIPCYFTHTHTHTFTCIHILSRALFHRVFFLFLFSPSLAAHVETCRYNCADRQLRNSYLTAKEGERKRKNSCVSFLPGCLALSSLFLSLSGFLSPRRAFVTFSFGSRESLVTTNFIARP